jgi:hypothetical protein
MFFFLVLSLFFGKEVCHLIYTSEQDKRIMYVCGEQLTPAQMLIRIAAWMDRYDRWTN